MDIPKDVLNGRTMAILLTEVKKTYQLTARISSEFTKNIEKHIGIRAGIRNIARVNISEIFHNWQRLFDARTFCWEFTDGGFIVIFLR